jgi:hypothetical protein
MKFTTVTGKDLDEVRKLLDAPLPDEAYKKIGGTSLDLTDISPAWTRRALTSIFGLYGFGWGMNHDGADVELTFEAKANGKVAADVAIKRMKFWYVLLDEKNVAKVFSFTTTGSGRNEQGNGGWALKGAMTNALSTAASFIGFQESVYMGKRGHNDTTGQAPRSGMSIDPAKTIVQEEQTPGVTLGEAKPASQMAQILYYTCLACNQVATVDSPIKTCPKCQSIDIKNAPTMAYAKKMIVANAPAPTEERTPPAAVASITKEWKNSSIVSQQTAACMACGSIVPVTPTCPDCGESTISTDTKALHEEMKKLGNNDRAVLLRRATDVTGRPIKGYAELSVEDLQALVYDLRQLPVKAADAPPAAAPKTVAAPPPVAPTGSGNGQGVPVAPEGRSAPGTVLSKVQMVQELFKAASGIGITTPAAILAELSQRWKRPIKSSSELTVDELATSLKEFQGVKP